MFCKSCPVTGHIATANNKTDLFKKICLKDFKTAVCSSEAISLSICYAILLIRLFTLITLISPFCSYTFKTRLFKLQLKISVRRKHVIIHYAFYLPFRHNHNSLRVYCASVTFHSRITTTPCVWQVKVIECPYNVIFCPLESCSVVFFRLCMHL